LRECEWRTYTARRYCLLSAVRKKLPAPRLTKSTKQIRRLPSNFASGIEIGSEFANSRRDAGVPSRTNRDVGGLRGAFRVCKLSHYGRRRQNSCYCCCRGGSDGRGHRRTSVPRGDKTAHNQFRTNEQNCVCEASMQRGRLRRCAPEAAWVVLGR